MAFFDDLGKKITGMTDVAKINSAISDENNKIQRNITELGKLYYATYAEECAPEFLPLVKAIQESEKKIAEYKRQKQDIKGIVRCTKCSAEIPANSVFCSVCGAPAPVQAPAGTAAYTAAAPAAAAPVSAGYVTCAVCGKTVDGNMKFCTQCGAQINQQPAAPVAPIAPVAPVAPVIPEPVAPVAPVIPEPVAPVAPVIPEPVAPAAPVIPEPVAPVAPVIPEPVAPAAPAFCTNCGTPIESGMAFCTNCGAKV